MIFNADSKEELKTYLIDLFSDNRINAIDNNETFPFSINGIDHLLDTIIESLPSPTPRDLNKFCDSGKQLKDFSN